MAANGDSTAAAAALEKLCNAYWYPLYAFVRRKGHHSHDAEDLTQEFFTRLLKRNDFAAASTELGRLRSFLLGALENFLANEWRKIGAEKRGGGKVIVSLDAETAEERYRLEPADHMTPEALYEKRWALTVLECVKNRLRREYAGSGKADLLNELMPFLSEKQPAPHADVAARLGVSVEAVGVAIHRLRRQYRRLMLDEIRQTLKNPVDAEEELRHLIDAVGR